MRIDSGNCLSHGNKWDFIQIRTRLSKWLLKSVTVSPCEKTAKIPHLKQCFTRWKPSFIIAQRNTCLRRRSDKLIKSVGLKLDVRHGKNMLSQHCYHNGSVKVRTLCDFIDTFIFRKETRQGCLLSLVWYVLFCIVQDRFTYTRMWNRYINGY